MAHAMTFAEKALAHHAGLGRVSPGEIVLVRPDVALSHDNSAAIAETFQAMGARHVFNPQVNAIFLDHAAPPPSTKHADNHRAVRDFVRAQGIKNFFDVGHGICHQVLVEEGLALPGEIVLGADSHTPHAGVMGAFAAGIGRTEMASVWALGEIWLRVPESIKILVSGELNYGVTAKDIALAVIAEQGADGALYMSVEWHGETIEALDVSERSVLTNMMAEMGAKNSIIPVDGKTTAYLSGRARQKFKPLHPDANASYRKTIEVDVSTLEPLVACPHRVDNVRPLSQMNDIRIDQAFLGTCTNGRLEDLEQAAALLKGRAVHQDVRFYVIPASARILHRAIENGTIETLLAAGAVLGTPGCGPCMGNHMGVPGTGEVTVSTANRNFQGRMGTRGSEIYLANPLIVAASAITGKLTHPKELL
ncbi:MAG: 3-isopropylmalate dehydratase large subunit [Anaerolineales bacterium]|nr:3-isopropylmalate dehydratase large subunit [Anaerolineales bacterium]